MNLLALLICQVLFSWDEAPPAENVTSYQIEQSDKAGDYTNAISTDVGLPDIVDGKRQYKLMIDRTLTKYFVVKAKNSFGQSPPSNEVRMGAPTMGGASLTVTPIQ